MKKQTIETAPGLLILVTCALRDVKLIAAITLFVQLPIIITNTEGAVRSTIPTRLSTISLLQVV